MRMNEIWTLPPRLGHVFSFGGYVAALLLISSVYAPLPGQAIPGVPSSAIPVNRNEHLATDPAVYARYARPATCYGAVQRGYLFYWRSLRQDTVKRIFRSDSTPAIVRTVAKTCAAKFRVDDVPVDQLVDLVKIYLSAGEPELAQRASRRLSSAITTWPADQRGEQLYKLAVAYMRARPAYEREAAKFIAELDAVGPDAAHWQSAVHGLESMDAMASNALPKAISESKKQITATLAQTKSQRIDAQVNLVTPYYDLSRHTYPEHGAAAAVAALDNASSGFVETYDVGTDGYAALNQYVTQWKEYFSIFGTPAAPLSAKHWFNTNNDTTTRPAAGQVTLVVFANPHCGGDCYYGYAALRRLHKKYAATGFNIVFVAQTLGYFRDESFTENPAGEVEEIRKYFLEFLKLPISLAVSETEYSNRLDGRRVNETTVNKKNYPLERENAVLVDREQKIRYVADLARGHVSSGLENILDAQIAKALGVTVVK